jgi:predicted GNAT family acetyltransferase
VDAAEVEPQVSDVEARGRYELSLDGERAGFAEYRREGNRTDFLHTEIDERFEGRGLGSRLVRAALEAERAAGRTIEPACPFVADYIRRHAEFRDLVAPEFRAQVEEPAG